MSDDRTILTTEQNLNSTDETCPTCGNALDECYGKYFCRECGGSKIPVSAQGADSSDGLAELNTE